MTDGPAAAPEVPLLARLARLRERVAALVEARSADDPTAADPLRGLYLSDEAVRHHVQRGTGPGPAEPGIPEGADAADVEDAVDGTPSDGERAGDAPAGPGAEDRLHRLALRLGLTSFDVSVLLIAVAPDLDRGFEPLYGYLNDDVSRRRATVGLALDLCGLPTTHADARGAFHRTAPLAACGLLVVEDPERPFLSRSLRVPDRVAAHLLGDDTPDAALDGYVRGLPPFVPHAMCK